MAGRRRTDEQRPQLGHADVLARLAGAAGAAPEPRPETVDQIRKRLLREVSSHRGRARLSHQALDSMVALLLHSQRD